MRLAMRIPFLLAFILACLPAFGADGLSGIVSSQAEGPMEGVLVSVKKEGSTITTTVVTDEKGRYSFPASRLSPGKYSLKVRAAGYDLPKKTVTVSKNTTANLSLVKTKKLADQLSNGEWMASMPGTDQQKGLLLNCVGCHTLERVVKSPYDASTFMKVVLP
ncbi:MAG TPA: carboxypeptidase-like regulatory domain-containing protein, partial [Burkholderiales bacterium]